MIDRRLPPLNALRAFESAARHLSLTRAAEELHVTPAAVSHQVKGLEAYLGVKLFRRANRALLLTLILVQGAQLTCGGDLPAHPCTGGRKLFYRPDDSPEQVGEGRGHSPCLQPAPQELVAVELIHSDVGARNQAVCVAPVEDQGDPPLDSRLP